MVIGCPATSESTVSIPTTTVARVLTKKEKDSQFTKAVQSAARAYGLPPAKRGEGMRRTKKAKSRITARGVDQDGFCSRSTSRAASAEAGAL